MVPSAAPLLHYFLPSTQLALRIYSPVDTQYANNAFALPIASSFASWYGKSFPSLLPSKHQLGFLTTIA